MVGRHTEPYISVCGPMGSGKTALTRLLASHFGWTPILEDLAANPYLEDYYTTDMSRWAYHTVTSFLIRSLTVQDEIARRLSYEGICQDWYVGERYGIYGVHLHEQGVLDDRELRTCQELHDFLMKHTVKPDVLVMLSADYATLRRRIAHRMRPGEAEVSQPYIESLTRRYSGWIDSLDIPCVRFDTGTLDFMANPSARNEIIKDISAALSH